MTLTVPNRLPTRSAQTPLELEPTPFGFNAPRLTLAPRLKRIHQNVIAAALNDRRIQEVGRRFDAFNDRGTKNHGVRVGWVAVAGGLELDLDIPDVMILARGAIAHDLGKADSRTQVVIRSRRKFEEDPNLLVPIHSHPIRGGLGMRDIGLGPNESMIGAGHHGFQTARDPYGIMPYQIRSFAEPDGHVPSTRTLVELTASADNLDALAVSPSETGRSYLYDGEVGAARAIHSIASLTVDDAVKEVIPRVVGLK